MTKETTNGLKDKGFKLNTGVTTSSKPAAEGEGGGFLFKCWVFVKNSLFPFFSLLASGLFIGFMLEQGRTWFGVVGGLSLFTLFMAGWRLWKGREVFLNVVEMGADQLDVALRQRRRRKEEKEDDKDE